METGENDEQPCWLILDAQSGEIVWWPKKEVVEQISRWEGLNTYYEAALSPDNKWIAMFLMDARLRNFFLVSLETDEIKYLGFTQKFFGAMNSPTNIPILIIWFRLEFGVWPLKKGTLENKLTNLISTKVLKCDKILPYPHIGVAL